MHKYTLIGGFAFNTQPLACLDQLELPLHAIDINTLLTAPFTLADLCEAIIHTLAHKKNNTLIAYSTGGLLAIKIATLRPDLIKQLILINSTPRFLEDTDWQGIKAKDFKRLSTKLDTLSPLDFIQHFTQLASFPNKMNPGDYINGWSAASKENLTALMMIILTTDLRDALKSLNLNIHFVNANQDILVPKNKLNAPQTYLTDSTHLQFNQSELLSIMKSALCH